MAPRRHLIEPLRPALTIRPMRAEDVNEIGRIYAQAAAHLRSIGDNSDLRFNAEVCLRDGFGDQRAFEGIVAPTGDRLVGYLLYTFGYDSDLCLRYLMVIDLAVETENRRHGVGKALMAEARQLARRHGCGMLAWWVHRNNETALRFYRGLGARDESTCLRYMTLRAME